VPTSACDREKLFNRHQRSIRRAGKSGVLCDSSSGMSDRSSQGNRRSFITIGRMPKRVIREEAVKIQAALHDVSLSSSDNWQRSVLKVGFQAVIPISFFHRQRVPDPFEKRVKHNPCWASKKPQKSLAASGPLANSLQHLTSRYILDLRFLVAITLLLSTISSIALPIILIYLLPYLPRRNRTLQP
jgi:hypothetical protein